MKRTLGSVVREAESLGIPTTWWDDDGVEQPIPMQKLLYAIKHYRLKENHESKVASQKFREITDLKKRGIL